jgi:hypothetical protein
MSSEKIEAFWENATAEDVARVMAGETVEARFWDDDLQGWTTRTLSGWQTTGVRPLWHSHDGFVWIRCQVYREPSWYTERPDPGPGFRLLGKFPDEPVAVGDEFFKSGQWYATCRPAGDLQDRTGWYRRRIEPVEPKFAVGQMVRVVGPKQIPALEWSSVGMAQYAGTTQTIERVELLTNPPGTYYHLKGVVNWCFREDYLEPVEPVESKPVLIRRRVVEIGDEIKLPNGRVLVFNGEGFEVTQ